MESVVILEVDEKELPELQYIYEMDEVTDEDLVDIDDTFK